MRLLFLAVSPSKTKEMDLQTGLTESWELKAEHGPVAKKVLKRTKIIFRCLYGQWDDALPPRFKDDPPVNMWPNMFRLWPILKDQWTIRVLWDQHAPVFWTNTCQMEQQRAHRYWSATGGVRLHQCQSFSAEQNPSSQPSITLITVTPSGLSKILFPGKYPMYNAPDVLRNCIKLAWLNSDWSADSAVSCTGLLLHWLFFGGRQSIISTTKDNANSVKYIHRQIKNCRDRTVLIPSMDPKTSESLNYVTSCKILEDFYTNRIRKK